MHRIAYCSIVLMITKRMEMSMIMMTMTIMMESMDLHGLRNSRPGSLELKKRSRRKRGRRRRKRKRR